MAESSGTALFSQLRRDAQAAAAQRIDAARAEAAQLRAAAGAELTRAHAAALAARARVHNVALERTRSDARARTARDWLTARAGAIECVFRAAQEMLATRAAEPRFIAAVTAGALEAVAYLPRGGAVARCASHLAPAVRAAFASQGPDHAALQVAEDDAIATGVVLETADHLLTIDATLARRLVRERARLAIDVARVLETPPP